MEFNDPLKNIGLLDAVCGATERAASKPWFIRGVFDSGVERSEVILHFFCLVEESVGTEPLP
jgi:hypothetical protein